MYTMAIGPPTCRGDDGGMHILWPEGEVGTGTGRAFTARLPQVGVSHDDFVTGPAPARSLPRSQRLHVGG